MLALAWANLTHHKLRTTLSALAVGLGLALFLVSNGLATGSIGEVADRMESVQAELLVLPAQENMVFSGGAVFTPGWTDHLASVADEQGPLATDVIPAYWSQITMGGQQQRLFGIDPEQMPLFLGDRGMVAGHAFEQATAFSQRIRELRATADGQPLDTLLDDDEWSAGLELVIDDRLRRVGQDGHPYEIGDVVRVLGREFRIVGVVESGVAGRVFAPIETLRLINDGGRQRSTMFFIKLRPGLDHLVAARLFTEQLGSTVQVQPTSDYGRRLQQELGKVFMYVNVTNTLALIVCFLFILLTMYTFVLERTREIGILKSLGVTRRGLIGLSMLEALLISSAGAVIGIALSFVAQAIIAMRLPLLTVELPPQHLATAVAIGLVGGIGSALYPGWRAARLEPAVALGYE
ncbi:MAG: ABC transporter permease [Phycisphaerae bacterium]|nr:ABC transporter permease [Phycisphaerae bacterium]